MITILVTSLGISIQWFHYLCTAILITMSYLEFDEYRKLNELKIKGTLKKYGHALTFLFTYLYMLAFLSIIYFAAILSFQVLQADFRPWVATLGGMFIFFWVNGNDYNYFWYIGARHL